MNRFILSVVGLLVLLTGCENYDITVNERLIYGPGRIFTDFETDDAALEACLHQAIADGHINHPRQLMALNCSDAGISDLSGLAQFPSLTQIKLSNNKIRNLVELGQLRQLERVWLDHNAVVDPVPLAQLRSLSVLDLSGNAALQCPQSGLLDAIATLTLPKHCQQD